MEQQQTDLTAPNPNPTRACILGSQEWEEFTDGEGNPYWYNSSSGVSQYEKPLGGGPAWTGGSITTASEGGGQG